MVAFRQGSERGADDGDDLPRWRRFVPAALGVALAAALGLLFVLANEASAERERALSLQRHSYEVIALARDVEASIARAESLLARYVVSLDANDGRRYTDEWQRAGTLIGSLQRATRDNPQQMATLRLLQAAYAERGRTFDDIALRTNYAQRLGALGRLYAANKTANADRIDQLLETTIERELGLLDERNIVVDRSELQVSRLSGSYRLAGLVLLVAALVAMWIANSAFSERRYARRLAESEARRVDNLELAVSERTQELEHANARLRTEMEERAQAEESLRQLHKMEAIGQLTGGIAHDFNNMLAVVMGGLELAQRRLTKPDEAMRHLENAMDGANRAASLTRRLLAFARAESLQPHAIDSDQLIRGMAEMIDRTIGDQIEVAMETQAGSWRIWADPGQLENAILNLCVNARDAMDGRGTLSILTRRATLAQGEISECAAGDYICLSVRDTGCGMAPEVMKRAFDPFFTTKPVGKGTGLGLSQVFGYVRQCGGHIRLSSAPGVGTEVQIYLPRDRAAEDGGPESAPASDMAQPQAPRAVRILAVEDDPRVLSATLSALEELGHQAVGCSHPGEARAMLSDRPDIELVLTDVLMPGLTGPELVARLRAGGMLLPVVFVTGFAGEDHDSGLLDGEHVLRKPYTLAQLGKCIGEAMERRPVRTDPAETA